MKASLKELLARAITSFVNKSGDTMTGPLVISNTTDANNRVFSIKRDSNNVDVGWDWTNKDGAGLGFRGADASSATFGNPGGFTFYARDENNSCYLDGYTDGRLIWNGIRLFGVSYVDVNLGTVTIGSAGYTNIASYMPSHSGTLLACLPKDFGTVASKTAWGVNCNGQYIFGTANTSITSVVLRYIYIDG